MTPPRDKERKKKDIEEAGTQLVSFEGLARTDPYELKCEILYTKCSPVVERRRDAVSLKIMQNYTTEQGVCSV